MNFKNTNIFFLIALGFIFYFVEANWSLLYYVLPLLLLYSLVIAWGSYNINLNFFLKSIQSNKKGFCLTFDDGPHPKYTPAILDVLQKHYLKATFFVIGNQIEGNEEILKRMVKEGHTIGNHTWSHSNLTALMTSEKLKKEIDKTNQLIEKVTGRKTIIFRPPFGVTNPRMKRVLKSKLMHSIAWDIRSYDTTAKNKTELIQRIQKGVDKGGSILLLHDNREITAEVLDELIQSLKNQNITFADRVTG